jgi:hypothetical protein
VCKNKEQLKRDKFILRGNTSYNQWICSLYVLFCVEILLVESIWIDCCAMRGVSMPLKSPGTCT